MSKLASFPSVAMLLLDYCIVALVNADADVVMCMYDAILCNVL